MLQIFQEVILCFTKTQTDKKIFYGIKYKRFTKIWSDENIHKCYKFYSTYYKRTVNQSAASMYLFIFNIDSYHCSVESKFL